MGKSTINGSFNGKIICKEGIFHCHVWLGEGTYFIRGSNWEETTVWPKTQDRNRGHVLARAKSASVKPKRLPAHREVILFRRQHANPFGHLLFLSLWNYAIWTQTLGFWIGCPIGKFGAAKEFGVDLTFVKGHNWLVWRRRSMLPLGSSTVLKWLRWMVQVMLQVEDEEQGEAPLLE